MLWFYRLSFPALWFIWMSYWLFASRNVKAVVRRESAWSRFLHLGPLVLAIMLLAPSRFPLSALNAHVWRQTLPLYWMGLASALAGLAFATWARQHLGRNWSASVTVKQQHELVTSGPYALARHPIYTGLIVAVAGSTLARGQLRDLIALALILASLWRKLQLEEAFMREQFGAAYLTYSERVRTLIPFLF